jgi:hypothetical protein
MCCSLSKKQGKLLGDTRVEIARVGFSVFVKKGAPSPDVGSIDALKRTLMAAKSIVLGDPAAGGGAGVYTAGLMQRLGLVEEIKARTRLVRSRAYLAGTVIDHLDSPRRRAVHTAPSIPGGSKPWVRARRASLALLPQRPHQNKRRTGAHAHRRVSRSAQPRSMGSSIAPYASSSRTLVAGIGKAFAGRDHCTRS